MRPHDNVVTRRTLLAGAAATAAITLVASPSSADTGDAAAPTGRASVPLPDGFQPEGITSGPGTRFYVGSVGNGRIITGDLLRGATSTLLPAAHGRSLRGLGWDSRTNLVWTVGNVGAVSHVWAVDATRGQVVSDTLVPGGGFLNDLAIGKDRIWVTDSLVDRLTVVPLTRFGMPTGQRASFVRLRRAWPQGDGVALNANGIRQLWDGTLVLNNSRVGNLWLVDPQAGTTTQLPVDGGPAITSGDGLVLDGTVLYDVRGSGQAELSVFRLSRSTGARPAWSARWVGRLTDPTLDVPSTATAAGRNIWAVNARFGVPSPGTASYSVTRLPRR